MARSKRPRSRRVTQKRESSKPILTDGSISIEVERTNTRLNKIPNPKPSQSVHRARYFLRVRVTALERTIYLPVSVASGRVSTGFVYQIEGTAAGKASATISCRGEGISMVTLGSILYSKIPVGKTATYTLLFTITDPSEESYKIVISRVNYKYNTNDPRYKRFLTEIETGVVESR